MFCGTRDLFKTSFVVQNRLNCLCSVNDYIYLISLFLFSFFVALCLLSLHFSFSPSLHLSFDRFFLLRLPANSLASSDP